MIVYKLTNKINGKVYIGQTIHKLSTRISQHKASKNTLISWAIRKHGIQNFDVSIVLRANNLDELNSREVFCIRVFNSLSPSGYNNAIGGKNCRLSNETKEKLRQKALGRKPSDEVRKKLSEQRIGKNNSMYGKKHSNYTKAILADSAKKRTVHGRTGTAGKFRHTEETKSRISQKLKGHKHNLGKIRSDKFKEDCKERITLRNQKKIINSIDGRVLDSVKQLAIELSMYYSTLVNMLNGRNPNKTTWAYL
jgi:group I intron endonuclease